jgi:hypothetical protein
MSANFAGWDDATLDLAVDLVTEGLDPADHLELEAKVLSVANPLHTEIHEEE